MGDLTAFIAARLDEDEAAARLAAREGGTWTQDDPERRPGAISGTGGPVTYDEGAPDERQAAHIARHDPARVLREVEAKREILTAYIKVDADGHRGDGWISLRFAVEALAAAWSDHGDYPGAVAPVTGSEHDHD